jgi:hypothetical protein
MKHQTSNVAAPRDCAYCKKKFHPSSPDEECLVAPNSTKDICHECYGLAVDRLQDGGKCIRDITDLQIIEYLEYGLSPPLPEREDR